MYSYFLNPELDCYVQHLNVVSDTDTEAMQEEVRKQDIILVAHNPPDNVNIRYIIVVVFIVPAIIYYSINTHHLTFGMRALMGYGWKKKKN